MKFKAGDITILNDRYLDCTLYYIGRANKKKYKINGFLFSSQENDKDLELYTDIFSI